MGYAGGRENAILMHDHYTPLPVVVSRYKGNTEVRNTKFLIYGKGEGDLVPLWTLFLRKYKGDFGPDIFCDEKKTALRVH